MKPNESAAASEFIDKCQQFVTLVDSIPNPDSIPEEDMENILDFITTSVPELIRLANIAVIMTAE